MVTPAKKPGFATVGEMMIIGTRRQFSMQIVRPHRLVRIWWRRVLWTAAGRNADSGGLSWKAIYQHLLKSGHTYILLTQ